MSQQKRSNLKVIIKQSIWSSISQPSTFIMFFVFAALTISLLVVMPLFLTTQAGIPSLITSQMFYPTALFTAIVTVIITINGFSLNEMTFVLSRPISRTHYLLGKYIASLFITLPMFLLVILSFFIAWTIYEIRGGINVFDGTTDQKLNWVMPIMSQLSVWLSTIATAIFLRMVLTKDRLISVICTWIAIAVFLLYNIISAATGHSNSFDPKIAYILIPVVVYGTFFISCCIMSIVWIKKYNVKV